MTIALKKDKKAKISDALSKADRIAIALGGKRFRPEEAVVASDFELE